MASEVRLYSKSGAGAARHAQGLRIAAYPRANLLLEHIASLPTKSALPQRMVAKPRVPWTSPLADITAYSCKQTWWLGMPLRIRMFGREFSWPVRSNVLETERQLQLLIDGVTDYAIYMLDPTGVVVSWNHGRRAD